MYSSKSLSLYGFVGFMFKGGTLQEGEIILGITAPATAGGCKDALPLQAYATRAHKNGRLE